MTEFSIRFANRPGKLAALTRLLADASIDIEALAAVGDGAQSHVRIVVTNAAKTRRLLMTSDIGFEERDVLDAFVARGHGGLAAVAQSLAAAGVNVDSMYLLHTNAEGYHLALTVSDPDLATRLLAS